MGIGNKNLHRGFEDGDRRMIITCSIRCKTFWMAFELPKNYLNIQKFFGKN
jgi:hypothetical protein